MSKDGAPPVTRNTTPGRKAIIVGLILITVSIIIGVVGGALTVGRMDLDAISRDVVIEGASQPKVPGRLSFSVTKPLVGSKSSRMHVGVGVDYTELPVPDCSLSDSAGQNIPLTKAGSETTLMRQGTESMTIVGSAKLADGDYELRCARPEGSADDGATFTVGHAFGFDDLTGALAPVVGFLIAGVVAILIFIVGVITLTVGLVKRGRARRMLHGPESGDWPPPSGHWPPPQPGPPSHTPISQQPPPHPGPGGAGGSSKPAETYPWRTGATYGAPDTPGAVEPAEEAHGTGGEAADGDTVRRPTSGWTVPPSKKDSRGAADQPGAEEASGTPSGWTVPPSKK